MFSSSLDKKTRGGRVCTPAQKIYFICVNSSQWHKSFFEGWRSSNDIWRFNQIATHKELNTMKQTSKNWQKKTNNIAVVEQWHSNHKTYPLIHWLRGRGPTGTVLLHFIRHIPSLWTLDQLPCHFSWAHLASTSHFPSASFFFCCGQITLFFFFTGRDAFMSYGTSR